MINFPNIFVMLLIIVALFDRFIIQRKGVHLIGIGKPAIKPNAIAFPIRLYVGRSGLGDALVDYSLQDLKNPSVVISGKARTINGNQTGVRGEYLLIDNRYLEPGRWDLRVIVTNGNCRLNPLYRIFPHLDVCEEKYRIEKDELESWKIEKE